MVVAGLSRRLILFGMAVITILSLLFGTAVRPAQSQEEPTQVIANTLVDIDQAAQCTAAGCRKVTFDARVVFNAEESIALTPEQAAAAQQELDNALFEITVTDASGNTREVEDGQTVCLKPGRYSVTAVLVNEGAVVSAVAAVLNGLGVPVDANDIVITDFSDSFVVEECEVDGNRDEGGDRNRSRGGAGGGLGLGVGDVFSCPQVQAAAAAQGQYGDATAGDLGSAAAIAQELGISQEQVNACIEGVAAGEDIVIGGQYGTATAAASASAAAGEEAVLPETSGASLIALGVGALLVAGGLLARRIVR